MERFTGQPIPPIRSRPGPIATLSGSVIMAVLFIVLFIFILPLALILLAVLVLLGLGIRAKIAFDNLGRRRDSGNDDEGRENVRIINR